MKPPVILPRDSFTRNFTYSLLITAILAFTGGHSFAGEPAASGIGHEGGSEGAGAAKEEGTVPESSTASDATVAGDSGDTEDSADTAGKGEKSDTPFRQDEISITATRTERLIFETPKPLTVATRTEMEREFQGTAIDSLDDKVGIWIEKRTITSSDPVIRGFAGGNILALVDGCTLTTLWGEGGYAGDDMYGKVDAESVDRLEVIRGPSAVLYGSNALGGVINFITKSCPLDYTEHGYDFGGLTKVGYGSASEYMMARQELWIATPHVRFFIGGTTRDYGHTEGGRGVGTMNPTNGSDYAFDYKMQYLLAENHELELAIQDVYRHSTKRFYRPTQSNFNDREAATLTWRATDISPYISQLTLKGYIQDKLDTRKDFHNRRTGEAHTQTFSGDLQIVSLGFDDHRLTGGLHYHEDHGESPDDEQFTWTSWDTGIKRKDSPDTIWANAGIYLQDEWDIGRDWTTIASVRYDSFHFDSNVDSYYQPGGAGFDPQDDDYADSHGIFSGGLGVVYRATQNVNLMANLTRGFRLFPPKFGITQHGDSVRAPHEFLDPIISHTVDLGTKVLAEQFAGSCFVYYSAIDNWQGLVPGQYNGSDWFDYDNDGIDPWDRVYVTETGTAYVYGIEIETETRLDLLHPDLPEDWVFAAGFAWNYGRDEESEEHMRHLQPGRALFALRWNDPDKTRNGWFELAMDVVGEFSTISPGRWNSDVGYLNDPQDPNSGQIRPDRGLPGYTVLDVRGGVDLTEDISVTMAVENLTDRSYRRAHSRWDEPGINFLASLTYRF